MLRAEKMPTYENVMTPLSEYVITERKFATTGLPTMLFDDYVEKHRMGFRINVQMRVITPNFPKPTDVELVIGDGWLINWENQ